MHDAHHWPGPQSSIELMVAQGAAEQAEPFRGRSPANNATAMSTAATEATLTSYLDVLLAGTTYSDYLAADVVLTIGGGPDIVGRAAVTAAIDGLHHVTFDAHPEPTMVVFGAGQAALEATFVATQIGEFAGIAPAGGTVAVPYSVFYELAGDKITALRAYGLLDGLIQQLSNRTTA